MAKSKKKEVACEASSTSVHTFPDKKRARPSASPMPRLAKVAMIVIHVSSFHFSPGSANESKKLNVSVKSNRDMRKWKT